jgi:hypothetical protein
MQAASAHTCKSRAVSRIRKKWEQSITISNATGTLDLWKKTPRTSRSLLKNVGPQTPSSSPSPSGPSVAGEAAPGNLKTWVFNRVTWLAKSPACQKQRRQAIFGGFFA